MNVKKETTLCNLMAILIIPALGQTVQSYVNVVMPYLLQDPEFFNIPYEEVGTHIGKASFTVALISTLAVPLLGQAYDEIGRRKVILFCGFLLLILLNFFPVSVPHMWLLILIWSMMSILWRTLFINPLICDYVKSESRGTANTLFRYGFMLAELIMITLFEFTRNMSLWKRFSVPALLLSPLAISLCFTTREPQISEEKLETAQLSSNRSTSVLDRGIKRFKLFCSECKTKPKYILCFCMVVTRFMNVITSIYLQLWIISFQHSGVLTSKDESDIAYRNIVIGT